MTMRFIGIIISEIGKTLLQDWYGHDNFCWKYIVQFTFDNHGDNATVYMAYSGDIMDEQRDTSD